MSSENFSAWLKALPAWAKFAAFLVTGATAVFVAGWNAQGLFEEQVGIPHQVEAIATRTTSLESRMTAAETQIAEISQNAMRLRNLTAKVDSMSVELQHQGELGADTYCIVYAHAKNLDVGQECTLVPPPIRRE